MPGMEAAICSDKTMNARLRFRFAGSRFPPVIVFKIVAQSHITYLSGISMIAPNTQVTFFIAPSPPSRSRA